MKLEESSTKVTWWPLTKVRSEGYFLTPLDFYLTSSFSTNFQLFPTLLDSGLITLPITALRKPGQWKENLQNQLSHLPFHLHLFPCALLSPTLIWRICSFLSEPIIFWTLDQSHSCPGKNISVSSSPPLCHIIIFISNMEITKMLLFLKF